MQLKLSVLLVVGALILMVIFTVLPMAEGVYGFPLLPPLIIASALLFHRRNIHIQHISQRISAPRAPPA